MRRSYALFVFCLVVLSSLVSLATVRDAHAEDGPLVDEAVFRDLGYPPAMLTADEPLFEAWLELPSDWDMQRGSLFEMIYSAPKLPSASATQAGNLVVTVNGEERHSEKLSADDVRFRRVLVEIPPISPTPKGIHVQVNFDAHEENCEPDERVIVLHEDSLLQVAYTLRPPANNLGEFPYPLVTQRARDIRALHVSLGKHDTAHQLAALQFLAALGKHVAGKPLDVRIVEPGAPLPEGNVLEVLLTDGGPPPTLSVRAHPGSDAFSVFTLAAADLEAAERVSQWVFSKAPLGARPSRTFHDDPPSETASPWLQAAVTFKDLGVDDFLFPLVMGVPKSLYFERPPGRVLDERSTLTLHYSVPGGTASGAGMRVMLGSESLGELAMEPGTHETALALPDGTAGNRDEGGRPARHLVLRLEASSTGSDGGGDDEECKEPRIPYITIKGKSAWQIEANAPEIIDLESFPAPLNSVDPDQPIHVVLGKNDARAGLGLVATIALDIGRDALLLPSFVYDPAAAPSVDAPLIAVGMPDATPGWAAVTERVETELVIPEHAEFDGVGRILLHTDTARTPTLLILTKDWDAARAATRQLFGTPGFDLTFDPEGTLQPSDRSARAKLAEWMRSSSGVWESLPALVLGLVGSLCAVVALFALYRRRRLRTRRQAA